MSALRTAAAKHTRSLSQPLRRTFYTPFAALQHSQLPTQSATASAGGEAAAREHEHEHEHAARTVYVVAEPNAADFKFYGVPAGAYPVATPYNHHQYPMGAHSTPAENANMNVSLLLSAVFINVMRPLFCMLLTRAKHSRHRRRERARLFLYPLGRSALGRGRGKWARDGAEMRR